jgi:hypothetical protein
VKTPARFHTDQFCSLFRALRPLGSEKIAKIFALRDCLQKFAGFSHGLGGKRSLRPLAATATLRTLRAFQDGSERTVATEAAALAIAVMAVLSRRPK